MQILMWLLHVLAEYMAQLSEHEPFSTSELWIAFWFALAFAIPVGLVVALVIEWWKTARERTRNAG